MCYFKKLFPTWFTPAFRQCPSLAVAQRSGISAAVISVVSAEVAAGLFYWYLTR